MRVPPLSPADLRELASLGVGFERDTPLWHYVLKEAEVAGAAASPASAPASLVKCSSGC